MANDTNLQFIREKVSQLRNAVMYVTDNNPVKFNNDVVTALTVDDEGQLWFLANHPSYNADEYEQSFPARLHFYRKGHDFFMEVSGKAALVKHDYSSGPVTSRKAGEPQNSRKILLKLTMVNIEYTEPHAKKPKSKIELVIQDWYRGFLRLVSTRHDPGSLLKKLRQSH